NRGRVAAPEDTGVQVLLRAIIERADSTHLHGGTTLDGRRRSHRHTGQNWRHEKTFATGREQHGGDNESSGGAAQVFTSKTMLSSVGRLRSSHAAYRTSGRTGTELAKVTAGDRAGALIRVRWFHPDTKSGNSV